MAAPSSRSVLLSRVLCKNNAFGNAFSDETTNSKFSTPSCIIRDDDSAEVLDIALQNGTNQAYSLPESDSVNVGLKGKISNKEDDIIPKKCWIVKQQRKSDRAKLLRADSEPISEIGLESDVPLDTAFSLRRSVLNAMKAKLGHCWEEKNLVHDKLVESSPVPTKICEFTRPSSTCITQGKPSWITETKPFSGLANDLASPVTTASSAGDFQDGDSLSTPRKVIDEMANNRTTLPLHFYTDPFEATERLSGREDNTTSTLRRAYTPDHCFKRLTESMCGEEVFHRMSRGPKYKDKRLAAFSTANHSKNFDNVPSIWKQRVVIILDWDDTIFPSSWLHMVQRLSNGDCSHIRPSNSEAVPRPEVCLDMITKTCLAPDQEAAMIEMEKSAFALLNECYRQGRLYIVTNAETGWVQVSAAHFMPRVFSFLAKYAVPIISARAWFHHMQHWQSSGQQALGDPFPSMEPDLWKVHTFSSLLGRIVNEEVPGESLSAKWGGQSDETIRQVHDEWQHVNGSLTSKAIGEDGLPKKKLSTSKAGEIPTNLPSRNQSTEASLMPLEISSRQFKQYHFLSIGDSECERRALLTCRETLYHHAHFKSVKLVEGPNPTLLVRQQSLLRTTLTSILMIIDCVDLVFVEPTTPIGGAVSAMYCVKQ